MNVNSQEYYEYSDKELVTLSQNANNDAAAELYRRYINRMLSYCNHFLKNKIEAEDVAQEICLKAFRNINKFRGDSSFSTWIYKIAKNTCVNKNNSLIERLRKLIYSIDEPLESGTSLHDILEGNSNSPREIMESNEIRQRLHNAIDKLPDKKRRVIYLRCIEDFSYNEISDITGLKLGTVKILIKRGREDLRVNLKNILKLRNSNL